MMPAVVPAEEARAPGGQLLGQRGRGAGAGGAAGRAAMAAEKQRREAERRDSSEDRRGDSGNSCPCPAHGEDDVTAALRAGCVTLVRRST
eukprot:590916-Prymnesium_polylepis.1